MIITDSAIGVIGTLAGTMVGYGLSIISERINEMRKVSITVETLTITKKRLKDTHGSYSIQFSLKLIVNNKSTIEQPLWQCRLNCYTNNRLQWLPVKDDKGSFGGPDQEFVIGSISPKSSEIFECRWNVNFKESPDFLFTPDVKFSYKTINGTFESPATPIVTGDFNG